MKNQATHNVSSVLRKLMTPAAFACALMVSTISSSVYANDKKEVVAAASSPVQVKYVGQIDKQPVIQIDISNAKQEELYVTLKDGDGYNLYTEKITGDRFSKKFQFSDQELNNMNVTVSLTSKQNKKPQVFQINNITTVVEDVVVTKVD